MNNYIVETASGTFVLIASATDSREAMETALTHAPEFGNPVGVRLMSGDPLDPEPPIALYLTAAR